MKILVTEDNADARKLCSKALRVEDHEVREAGSGQEALSELKNQFQPDLILLDLSMPDMDGESFMATLRAS
jgi:CheY-like chemotaxis protein